MTCERWQAKIDTYVDGELSEAGMQELGRHLAECPDCSSQTLARSQLKRSVHLAGRAFAPSVEFTRRMKAGLRPQDSVRRWRWLPQAAVGAAALALVGAVLTLWPDRSPGDALMGEVTDLHIATLASANPVDVVSSDRHTVKPWFQGRIPFTFNLPELNGSPFELVGGKVSYLGQEPGAELLFNIRKHVLSLFIFKDSRELDRQIGSADRPSQRFSFNVISWSEHGLRYIIVSDASPADINDLRARVEQRD